MHHAATAPRTHLPMLPPGFSLPRSLALASAITLHLVLAAAMWAPFEPPRREAQDTTRTPVVFEAPRRPPPLIPPPPRPVPVVRRPVATPTPSPVPPAAIAPQQQAGPTIDLPSPLDAPAIDTGPGAGDDGPAIETLVLRSGSPPRYPSAALMRNLEGEVELLILVGVDGRPEDVSVARSSGHAMLDRAAREHVKRRWVFEPAMRHGIAVPAWARVPVRFTLPR